VDDSQPKLRKVIDLFAGAGIPQDSLSVAHTADEARRYVKANKVDLLVLDLMLPNRVGDVEKLETALEFLRQLREDDDFIKPTHVVGLTAYEEAQEKAYSEFQSYTWTILAYSDSVDGWKSSLIKCAQYVSDTLRTEKPREYLTDVCIITALEKPEMKAIKALPWNWHPDEPLDDVLFYSKGSLPCKTKTYSVSSVCAGRMGMVAAAIVASKAIELLRPRILIMAGICAGMPKKVNGGDAILADPCWDWQSGKKSMDKAGNKRLQVASDQIPIHELVRSKMQNMSRDSALLEEIRNSYPSAPDNSLRIHMGPVATGSSVLADGETIAEIADQHRGLLGVEMEIYGVYQAARLSSRPRPLSFAVKSVCDFADADKDDSLQPYAAYTSANILRFFLERHIDQLIE
jgi:nucleoside phosphorylase